MRRIPASRSTKTNPKNSAKPTPHTATAFASVLKAGGSLSGGGDAIREAMNEEKGKLETTLKGFLTPEQTASTSALLRLKLQLREQHGESPERRSCGLDEAKHGEAMKVVATYLADSTKAREAAGGDRKAMRAKGKDCATS